MKRVVNILLLALSLCTLQAQNKISEIPVKVIDRDSVVSVTTPGNGVDTLYRTDSKVDVTIFYRFDKSKIDSTYLSNMEVLEYIDEQLTDSLTLSCLDSLSLSAISSPEGPLTYNQGLSQRRVDSFRRYLVSKYPYIEPKIVTGHAGEEWARFRELIAASTKIPNKEEVLSIVDSDIHLDAKEYKLKHLAGGRPWRFIVYNILRYLRYGGTAIFYYNDRYVLAPEPEVVGEPVVEKMEEMVPEPQPEPVVPEPEPLYVRRPIMAFKTNMLSDALTILNVSAEVPIGERYSVAGEWTFPWWVWDNGVASSKRNRLQMLYANFEGRYWFGDRTDREVMTGWFGGIYGGTGKYDFEYHTDGVQGEFYSAGLVAGYAHSINKKNTLRLEYSVSAGYVNSYYRDYNAMFADKFDDRWHPIRRSTGTFGALVPTSAKISLVWMLYYNKRVK